MSGQDEHCGHTLIRKVNVLIEHIFDYVTSFKSLVGRSMFGQFFNAKLVYLGQVLQSDRTVRHRWNDYVRIGHLNCEDETEKKHFN